MAEVSDPPRVWRDPSTSTSSLVTLAVMELTTRPAPMLFSTFQVIVMTVALYSASSTEMASTGTGGPAVGGWVRVRGVGQRCRRMWSQSGVVSSK